jgi:two-component sensor histidine kinase
MPSGVLSELSAFGVTQAGDFPPNAFVAEANHRIANNLAVVAALVRMQSAEVHKAGSSLSAEAVSSMLAEVSSRIDTVCQFHRLLACQYVDAVALPAYLGDVAEAALTAMAGVGKLDLDLSGDPDCMVPATQALRIGLIVGELVVNAVKYAHPAAGVTGKVQVGCHVDDNGQVVISVADDGVGFPEGYDPHKDGGLGMRIVRSLASQLSATLSFRSTCLGLTTTLRVSPSAND